MLRSLFTRQLSLIGIVCLMGLFLTRAAAAESSAADKAAAEALFQDGRKLMQSGKFEEACPKFEASQRLDEGVGTLLLLAECYSKVGRTASAWVTFKEAAAAARAAGQTQREELARTRAKELEGKLSRIELRGQGNTMALEGLEVQLNGTQVPKATWGVPVPVDPGLQEIKVMAPGYAPWSTQVEISPEGGTQVVEIPLLKKLPESKVAPEVGSGADVTTAPVEPVEDANRGNLQRTIAWVVGGAGVVGLAAGTFFGLRAQSKNNESEQIENCPLPNQCTQTGLDLRDDAQTAASVSTVAFVAGTALLAGGVVLYLTAPNEPTTEAMVSDVRVQTSFGPGSAGVSLGGNW